MPIHKFDNNCKFSEFFNNFLNVEKIAKTNKIQYYSTCVVGAMEFRQNSLFGNQNINTIFNGIFRSKSKQWLREQLKSVPKKKIFLTRKKNFNLPSDATCTGRSLLRIMGGVFSQHNYYYFIRYIYVYICVQVFYSEYWVTQSSVHVHIRELDDTETSALELHAKQPRRVGPYLAQRCVGV